MADVALDASVLVAWLDAGDALHGRAKDLPDRLRAAGDAPVFLDVCIAEAVSVTCRRARERKTRAPDLEAFLDLVGKLHELGEITFVAGVMESRLPDVLGVVRATGGVLNVNDALLVVLQRDGDIGDLALSTRAST
jgi:predicted nucleic acid-binding protein